MLFLMILQVLGSNDSSSKKEILTITFKNNEFFYSLNGNPNIVFKLSGKFPKNFPKNFYTVTVELPDSLINIFTLKSKADEKKQVIGLFHALNKYKINVLILKPIDSEEEIDSLMGAFSIGYKEKFFYEEAVLNYFKVVTEFIFANGFLNYVYIDDKIPSTDWRGDDSPLYYELKNVRKHSTHLMKFSCFYYLWKEKNPQKNIQEFYDILRKALKNILETTYNKYPEELKELKILSYNDSNFFHPTHTKNSKFLEDLLCMIDIRIEQFKIDEKIENTEKFKNIMLKLLNIKDFEDFYKEYLKNDFIGFIFNIYDVKEYIQWIMAGISNNESRKIRMF